MSVNDSDWQYVHFIRSVRPNNKSSVCNFRSSEACIVFIKTCDVLPLYWRHWIRLASEDSGIQRNCRSCALVYLSRDGGFRSCSLVGPDSSERSAARLPTTLRLLPLVACFHPSYCGYKKRNIKSRRSCGWATAGLKSFTSLQLRGPDPAPR